MFKNINYLEYFEYSDGLYKTKYLDSKLASNIWNGMKELDWVIEGTQNPVFDNLYSYEIILELYEDHDVIYLKVHKNEI